MEHLEEIKQLKSEYEDKIRQLEGAVEAEAEKKEE